MKTPGAGVPTGFRLSRLAALALASATCGFAQIPLVGSGPYGIIRIFNEDLAILETREPRKDLPCSVSPVKAALGFDLRLHAGYEVSIPLRTLAGEENLLSIIFRVTPEEPKGDAIYFVQRIRVPEINADASGDAYLQGSFDLGEGKYRVDWLMRDRTERVCSDYWSVEARLQSGERDVSIVMPAGSVEATPRELFQEEPPVVRAEGDSLLNVKVLINFAPQKAYSAVLQPLDISALVSILRSISREPRIGKFSVIAFNVQEQRVIYRQDDADRIDFPELGEALDSLNLGTVDLKRLGEKHGDTHFLADLLRREIAAQHPADALVFAGPKAMLEENVDGATLRQLGELSYPVFYMNYNLNPHANPWRDTIGYAVKALKGTEFTISRPRDLWFAVTEMVTRIMKFREEKTAARVSGM